MGLVSSTVLRGSRCRLPIVGEWLGCADVVARYERPSMPSAPTVLPRRSDNAELAARKGVDAPARVELDRVATIDGQPQRQARADVLLLIVTFDSVHGRASAREVRAVKRNPRAGLKVVNKMASDHVQRRWRKPLAHEEVRVGREECRAGCNFQRPWAPGL